MSNWKEKKECPFPNSWQDINGGRKSLVGFSKNFLSLLPKIHHMRYLSTLLLAFIFVSVQAQFTSPPNKITDTRPISHPFKLNKSGNSPVKCEGDTIEYARFKASALVAVNISTGYRLGQFYRAPGKVTISGFEFFAWQTMQNANKVEVYAELFNAGKDSLPSGNPVRVDTLTVDSTFGSGALNEIRFQAKFDSAYTTDKPYILVLSSNDTNRVGIVCNSYNNGDGDGENLGCGTVGGRWFRMLSLNINGTALDCDVLAAPFVEYSVYNDFDFRNCFAVNDSVEFTNTSSGFYFDPMYNRYSFFDLDRFCHRWSYGDGRTYSEVENKYKYTSTKNYTVQLVSTLFKYRGNARCIDTAIKTLEYMPSNLNIQGERDICSGNSTTLQAFGNAPIHWYNNKTDTASFRISDFYKFPVLEENDTIFLKSINGKCSTKMYEAPINVTTTPDSPAVFNDSICLNSMANLVAKTNAGEVIWYADEFGNIPADTGELFQIGPLSRDTFFFAKARNGDCTHDGYMRVDAFVSNAFAPQAPITSNDTVVCLEGGDVSLQANSSNTVRWYKDPTDVQPFSTASVITVSPTERGTIKRYVEAYDGNCPSSKLEILVDVNHFDAFDNLKDTFVCTGSDAIIDFTNMHGDISWYSDAGLTQKIKETKIDTFRSVSEDAVFYLVPFEGLCVDSIGHKFEVVNTPYPKEVSSKLDSGFCTGSDGILRFTPDVGKVRWLDENMNFLGDGTEYTLRNIQEEIRLYLQVKNRHCSIPNQLLMVQAYPQPDANFDYQAKNDRSVDFLSRYTGEGRYSWDFGDGNVGYGTDYTHLYGKDGEYDVSLVVVNDLGCSDTVTKKVLVMFVGIDDVSSFFQVYPNPTTSKVFIKDSRNTILNVTVLNALGQPVRERSAIGNEQIELSFADLAAGFYYLEIQTEAGKEIVKVIRK
jgi:hypothetical protein